MTKTKSPGCDKCRHPLFAAIKCDICGWKASQLHTCSYSCTRPACVLAQRDELRAKLEDSQAVANSFANLRQADEALMLQALEALRWEWGDEGPDPTQAAITALRQRLEEQK